MSKIYYKNNKPSLFDEESQKEKKMLLNKLLLKELITCFLMYLIGCPILWGMLIAVNMFLGYALNTYFVGAGVLFFFIVHISIHLVIYLCERNKR